MRGLNKIKNLKEQVVLVRVDFNLPIKDGKVEDVFRIERALPTIKFLQDGGAKIILITHLGKNGESLAPVAIELNKLIKVKFVPEVIGPQVTEAVKGMEGGEVILLENLRKNPGEQEKNQIFAMNLAKLATVYVNEAFPVSHREDTSIVLLPKLLPSYAGLQLEKEVKNLSHAFERPKSPFLFILGGAKFSTKIPLIEKYLKLADDVFVGGALADDFFVAQGLEVGRSLVSEEPIDLEKILKNEKLILPTDVVVKVHDKLVNKKVTEVEKKDTILDIGEESVQNLGVLIKKAKLILWNGPLGKFEDGGAEGTKAILKLVASSKAETILGGGETVVLVREEGLEDKFSFVSTGGGATLDFLASGTLPGIKALE